MVPMPGKVISIVLWQHNLKIWKTGYHLLANIPFTQMKREHEFMPPAYKNASIKSRRKKLSVVRRKEEEKDFAEQSFGNG